MRLLKTRREQERFLGILAARAAGPGREIESTVRKILDEVRREGDRAVLRYTKKFDWEKTNRLAVSRREISSSADKAGRKVIRALAVAARRIRAFHERQRERSWTVSSQGSALGQIIRPLNRVGVYVPGGKASYPSTVLMNAIPALVAGVKEIALCVPMPGGQMNPAVMAAIRLLDIAEVYRIGGVQAIGALAYGTESIGHVDKIVGPGNIYVATAKKMVFGSVDIDMIAGPSEILVIADSSANPAFVAADLLAQAEHDELASSVLVTDSSALANAVRREIDAGLSRLGRESIARRSLEAYGGIFVTAGVEESVAIANRIAPEHLEIMTRRPSRLLPQIRNAGAIFLGRWTPEALGDYAAGPNHTLPTGGTARFSSPLGVYDFVKRSSVVRFSKKGFLALADTVKTIADAEGLEAHGYAVRVREGRAR